MPGVVVVGAGPGIGTAVARRFAASGMPVGLIARSAATLEGSTRAVAPFTDLVSARQADVADEGRLQGALRDLRAAMGVPEVVVYNAALDRHDTIAALTGFELMQSWAVNVVGAAITAAEVLPRMAARGSGTMILTGCMPQPLPNAVSLSLGKAGLRALGELLGVEFGPWGLHVATVTICGRAEPGTDLDPADIADEYWRLHCEAPQAWRNQVNLVARGAGTRHA